MDILSVLIAFFSLIWNIIITTKLYIIYLPSIACEIAGVSSQTTKSIIAASIMLWLAVWIKTIINYFRK